MPERVLGTSPRPLFQLREPAFRRASGCTPRRQASEQYRTRSQSRSHFLRQEKGRAQAAQTLVGKWAFFMRRWLAGPGAQETFPKAKSWILDPEWSGRQHLGWHPFQGLDPLEGRTGCASPTLRNGCAMDHPAPRDDRFHPANRAILPSARRKMGPNVTNPRKAPR